MNFIQNLQKDSGLSNLEKRADYVQLFCLAIVLFVSFLSLTVRGDAAGTVYLTATQYLSLPAMVFLGVSVCRPLPRRDRRLFYITAVMMAVFFYTQNKHLMLENDTRNSIGSLICAYVLCLPFSAANRDASRQWGLKLGVLLFLVMGLIMTGGAVLLLLDAVPARYQEYIVWGGARIQVLFNPNICAFFLMISIGFLCGIALQTKHKWLRIGLLMLTVLEFGALALTSGRTGILCTLFLLGGLLFCMLRKTGWKRFLAAVLAAVMLMAVLFAVSTALFNVSRSQLIEELSAQEEPLNNQEVQILYQAVNEDRTMSVGIQRFGGRSGFWKAAVAVLKNQPEVFLYGTEWVSDRMFAFCDGPVKPQHSHNSWLDVTLRMGVGGLVVALVLTVMALWYSAVLLWRNTDMWKNCVALVTLAMLGCGLMEPILFLGNINYYCFDFLFMLCVGYLYLWGKKEEVH